MGQAGSTPDGKPYEEPPPQIFYPKEAVLAYARERRERLERMQKLEREHRLAESNPGLPPSTSNPPLPTPSLPNPHLPPLPSSPNPPKSDSPEKNKSSEVKSVPKKRRRKEENKDKKVSEEKKPKKQKEEEVKKEEPTPTEPASSSRTAPKVAASDDSLAPQKSISSSSIKSEDKSSKSSRKGSWEYVPAEPRIAYPKKMDRADRAAREIAKLAMDVVDSPHDLSVAPEDWYTSSDYDINRPISMADRVKLGRRAVKQPARISPDVEVKPKKPSKKSTGTGRPRGRPKKTKDEPIEVVKTEEETEDEEKEKAMVPIKGPKDQNDSPLERNVSYEGGLFPIDSSTPFNGRSPDTSSSMISSAYSEELGTPFELLEADMRRVESSRALSAMDGTENYPLHSTSYSLLPPRDNFSNELPDNILEESNQLAIGEEGADVARIGHNSGRLPTQNELDSLEILYCKYGVLYRPLVLVVRPITLEISMEGLRRTAESENSMVIPTRRPSAFDALTHFGHAAIVHRSIEKAREMLANGNIGVNDQLLNVEQPGAIFVQVDEQMTGEDDVRRIIESTLGAVLDLRTISSGYAVVLPSTKKASEYIEAGSIGPLSISSLNTINEKYDFKWPVIDTEWAKELGME